MKLDRLETHDRLLYFNKQNAVDLSTCCQSIINQRPFGDRSFYIFAHKREIAMDERYSLFVSGMYPDLASVPTHRMIWQPRLTKPQAQTNSMLFKGYPDSDMIKIIWIIPERELWDQYCKGNLTESETISESIDRFMNDREGLEAPEPDDATEGEINALYSEIAKKDVFRMI